MMVDVSELEQSAVEAFSAGRIDESDALCREVLGQDPRNYRVMVLLAAVLREKGSFLDAAGVAERAIRLGPRMVEAYYQFALSMIDAGRPESAQTALRTAIELRPEIPVFRLQMGLAHEAIGNRGAARRCFEECLRLDPNQLQARLCLVDQLLANDEIDAALVHGQRALEIAPQSVAAHLSMAEALTANDQTQEAESYLMRALELNPNNATALAMKGFRQLQGGDFVAAARSFRRSIELEPAQGVAYLGLGQTKKLKESDREILSEMEGVRKKHPLSASEASSLSFAIAKACDDLGNYEKAMAAYDDAQRNAAQARFGSRRFDQDQYRTAISQIRHTFSREFLEGRAEDCVESHAPILIVGMIRSGTTLAEQILSSHPHVGAAGEHSFWKKHAGRSDLLQKLATDPAEAGRAARGYLRALQACSPTTDRVTDKLPGNYLRLGLIHKILPNAKIIHCRRNPLDTAFSIYTTPNRSAPSFSHFREDIVFAYRQYEELMEHWRGILPASGFLEIRYEQLVDDPQAVVAQMLEFCELDWDEACLHPELNPKPVATPSLWQVRQPIYRSSVEKWRRYEPWLGELRELQTPT